MEVVRSHHCLPRSCLPLISTKENLSVCITNSNIILEGVIYYASVVQTRVVWSQVGWVVSWRRERRSFGRKRRCCKEFVRKPNRAWRSRSRWCLIIIILFLQLISNENTKHTQYNSYDCVSTCSFFLSLINKTITLHSCHHRHHSSSLTYSL